MQGFKILCSLSAALLLAAGCDSKSSEKNNRSSMQSSGAKAPSAEAKPTPPAQPPTRTINPALASAGPSWEVAELVHNFGTVWTGKLILHPFHIKNVGTQTLRLSKPKAYCSCSSADSYPETIEPGQTGTIMYRLDMRNKADEVNEYLDVETNDPLKRMMRLQMTGFARTVAGMEVIADSALDEGRLPPDKARDIVKARGDFGRVKVDDTLRRVIRLTNKSGAPLQLELLPSRAAAVQTPTGQSRAVPAMFDAVLNEIEPGQVYEVTIVSQPPFSIGSNVTSFQFKTGLPDYPAWELKAYAFCPPRVEITPHKIVFNQQASSPRRPITIRNNGDVPFDITAVSATDPNFKVTLLPRDPADPTARIVEVLIPQQQPVYALPPYGEIIRIETTDAEMPLIEVIAAPSFAAPAPRPADKPAQFYPGTLLQ